MHGKKEAVITIKGYAEPIDNICSMLRDDITLTINDIECLQAKGSLYILNLPEDIWQVEETDGKKYFNVATENSYTTCWEDTYINQLSNNEYLKYEQSIK